MRPAGKIQVWWMKAILNNLDTVEDHIPDFDHDIDSDSDALLLQSKTYLQDLNLHLQLTMKSVDYCSTTMKHEK